MKPLSSTGIGRITGRRGTISGCSARSSTPVPTARMSTAATSRLTVDTSKPASRSAARSSRTKSASSRASGTSILLSTTARGRSAKSPSVVSPCRVGVRGEFGFQRVDIGDRVAARLERGAVDHVDEHRAPLDVPQKVQAEAAALGGAGNQPRHVGHGERVLARGDDAQVRGQRGERIVRDLRLGRRDRRDQ